MSSIVINFPGSPVSAHSGVTPSISGAVRARGERIRPVRRRPTVLAQIEGMRAHGMSDTGIRRALGLSERQAVEAGIIPARPDTGPDGEPPTPKVVAQGARERAGGRDVPGRGPGGPRLAEVLAAVARAGGVDRAEIVGPSQGRHLTPLRQLTMYLLREVCAGASLPAIGHFLGRDHTTVHYGCRKAAQRLSTDPGFARLYEAIRSALAPPEGPADG
jgi:hypothetical protein